MCQKKRGGVNIVILKRDALYLEVNLDLLACKNKQFFATKQKEARAKL